MNDKKYSIDENVSFASKESCIHTFFRVFRAKLRSGMFANWTVVFCSLFSVRITNVCMYFALLRARVIWTLNHPLNSCTACIISIAMLYDVVLCYVVVCIVDICRESIEHSIFKQFSRNHDTLLRRGHARWTCLHILNSRVVSRLAYCFWCLFTIKTLRIFHAFVCLVLFQFFTYCCHRHRQRHRLILLL